MATVYVQVGDQSVPLVFPVKYYFDVVDVDGDGVKGSADVFPHDPTETTDTDGDGVGDNSDAFPNDPTETVDTDGDGQGDNSDPFPNDPLNGAAQADPYKADRSWITDPNDPNALIYDVVITPSANPRYVTVEGKIRNINDTGGVHIDWFDQDWSSKGDAYYINSQVASNVPGWSWNPTTKEGTFRYENFDVGDPVEELHNGWLILQLRATREGQSVGTTESVYLEFENFTGGQPYAVSWDRARIDHGQTPPAGHYNVYAWQAGIDVDKQILVEIKVGGTTVATGDIKWVFDTYGDIRGDIPYTQAILSGQSYDVIVTGTNKETGGLISYTESAIFP